MIFRCKNCGGAVTYHPKEKEMICDSCGSANSEECIAQEQPFQCLNCGAEIEAGEHVSATKCLSCSTPLVIAPRVEYPYGPDVVLPFKVDKYTAIEMLREYAKKKLLIPGDFVSNHSLEQMEGIYVPFWLYDFLSKIDYRAIGIKVRHWRSGNYEYTETSRYQVARKMDIDFRRIPLDASVKMPDSLMDLIEPYKYDQMEEFKAGYLSGFEAEKYNLDPNELMPRAEKKVMTDANSWLNSTISQYTRMEGEHRNIQNHRKGNEFALLPVWNYKYRYNGKDYDFYINGQTGKIAGQAPISIARVFGVSLSLFGTACFFIQMLGMLLEVL